MFPSKVIDLNGGICSYNGDMSSVKTTITVNRVVAQVMISCFTEIDGIVRRALSTADGRYLGRVVSSVP